MTTQEANDNIGQEFKTTFLKGGKFDTIRKVDPDGVIHGDFLIAYAKDCRLKGSEPLSLKNSHKKNIQSLDQKEIDRMNQDEYEKFNGHKLY